MRKIKIYLCAAVLAAGLSGAQTEIWAKEGNAYGRVAKKEEQAEAQAIGKYGMLPIYGRDVQDGTYEVEVESSSRMFRVVQAVLRVEDGEMEAAITLSGQGYSKLFLGTGQEAAESGEAEYIGYAENEEGQYTYQIPVEALDKKLCCAAFSKKKQQWYDRELLFDASSLPREALLLELPDYERIEEALEKMEGASEIEGSREDAETASGEQAKEPERAWAGEAFEPMAVDKTDGEYSIEVELFGGSGKAAVVSPTLLIVREGKAYASLQWSSENYDYMIVGGEKYLNTAEEGRNSVFEIPIAWMDEEMEVIADTTAMGTPHEVEYSLSFFSDSIGSKSQLPQEAAKKVVLLAMVIIVGGGILNHILKKKRSV